MTDSLNYAPKQQTIQEVLFHNHLSAITGIRFLSAL